MRFYRVFCFFFTFVRWKTCSVELQSNSFIDGTIIDDGTKERQSDMSTVSPVLRYSVHASSQNKDSHILVSNVPFGLQLGLAKNPVQMELPVSILASITTPDVSISSSTVTLEKTEPLGLMPLQNMKLSNFRKNPEMFMSKLVTPSPNNNAPLASSSQPVPSKLVQTSLAEANLMPKANPISARMLNIPPDIIMTSPINSPKGINEQVEIHATPTVVSSRIESPSSSRSLESYFFPERDITTVPNSTRQILQANGTKSVRVEKRTNSHTMVIVPAVIGVISVLSVGFMAALYQWHQRGRRRKVYLSHPGVPPKDFAEDTGVRSPVLLPDEIEMQVGRSQSLRVRRAVILATDPPVIEADSITLNVDSVTNVDGSGDPVINSIPPPPPYREPPPYLPDMVIENIHAL